MKQLINLQVIEAKNVICVWREDVDENFDVFCGIESDTALCNYMVPQYIAIGTFSDGTTRAAGLLSLNDLNGEYGDIGDLFLFHQFLHGIDLNFARALVRGVMEEEIYKNEASTKANILNDMLKANIKISHSALAYLRNRKKIRILYDTQKNQNVKLKKHNHEKSNQPRSTYRIRLRQRVPESIGKVQRPHSP